MHQLLYSSTIPFVFQLTNYTSDIASKTNSFKRPRTISSQFRDQLSNLIGTINSSKTHYVRCIKSNDMNQRDCLERKRLVEQLKCAGVMEAVRISRSGYPYRMLHPDFYARYRLLLTGDDEITESLPLRVDPNNQDMPQLCRRLFKALVEHLPRSGSSEMSKDNVMQLGRTKVFLRKGSYDMLEMARGNQLHRAARKIQSVYRGHLAKRGFSAYRYSTRRIQRAYKAFRFNKMLNSRVFKRADSERRRRLAEEQKEQERVNRAKKELERKRLEMEEAERQRLVAEEREAMRFNSLSDSEKQQEAKRRDFEAKVRIYIENIKNKEKERRMMELQSRGVQLSLQ